MYHSGPEWWLSMEEVELWGQLSLQRCQQVSTSCHWRTHTCTPRKAEFWMTITQGIFRTTMLTREEWQPTEGGRDSCPGHLPVLANIAKFSCRRGKGERHLRTRLFSNEAPRSRPCREGIWGCNWERGSFFQVLSSMLWHYRYCPCLPDPSLPIRAREQQPLLGGRGEGEARWGSGNQGTERWAVENSSRKLVGGSKPRACASLYKPHQTSFTKHTLEDESIKNSRWCFQNIKPYTWSLWGYTHESGPAWELNMPSWAEAYLHYYTSTDLAWLHLNSEDLDRKRIYFSLILYFHRALCNMYPLPAPNNF